MVRSHCSSVSPSASTVLITVSLREIYVGDYAEHYFQFLLRSPRLRREGKIMHFKPDSPVNGLGFNPFQCGLADPAEVANLVLEAFMKVWGEDSFNETPRLERVLRIMFHVFALTPPIHGD